MPVGVVIVGSGCGVLCSALLMGMGHGVVTVLAGYPLGGLFGVALLVAFLLAQSNQGQDNLD